MELSLERNRSGHIVPQRAGTLVAEVLSRRVAAWLKLLASEALEVGHLRGHFFASGIGGGTNTLDAQFEFVWIGRARESFVEGDEFLGVQVEERLIEGLHAVLRSA